MLLLLLPPRPSSRRRCARWSAIWSQNHSGKIARLFNRGRAIEVANSVRRSGKWTKEATHQNALGGYGCIGDVPIIRATNGEQRRRSTSRSNSSPRSPWWSEGGVQRGAHPGDAEPTRRVRSRYILRRHPRLFDFAILEEAHMFAHGESAQSQARSVFSLSHAATSSRDRAHRVRDERLRALALRVALAHVERVPRRVRFRRRGRIRAPLRLPRTSRGAYNEKKGVWCSARTAIA